MINHPKSEYHKTNNVAERKMSMKIARLPTTAVIAKKWQLKAHNAPHMQNFRLKLIPLIYPFLLRFFSKLVYSRFATKNFEDFFTVIKILENDFDTIFKRDTSLWSIYDPIVYPYRTDIKNGNLRHHSWWAEIWWSPSQVICRRYIHRKSPINDAGYRLSSEKQLL